MTSANRPVAIVTEARRGIGRAIAVGLAQAGFDLVLADIAVTDELQAAVGDVVASGARAIALAVDLRDLGAHDRFLEAAESAMGRLDCLVNNAGVSVLARGDVLGVTSQADDPYAEINTRGSFYMTQAFARRLLARAPAQDHHRSIITITSSSTQAASTQRGEYGVAEAALSMASTLLAVRLGSVGIGIYEVVPGLMEPASSAVSTPREDAALTCGRPVPSRRGRPEAVSSAVVELAKGMPPGAVGQAIRADGGMPIHRH